MGWLLHKTPANAANENSAKTLFLLHAFFFIVACIINNGWLPKTQTQIAVEG
jgi:hypothetical protein